MSDTFVIIEMFDITGCKIKTVFENEVVSKVIYDVYFIPADIADGHYIYRITIGNTIYDGKVVYKK